VIRPEGTSDLSSPSSTLRFSGHVALYGTLQTQGIEADYRIYVGTVGYIAYPGGERRGSTAMNTVAPNCEMSVVERPDNAFG
jgi:hypothetical protein